MSKLPALGLSALPPISRTSDSLTGRENNVTPPPANVNEENRSRRGISDPGVRPGSARGLNTLNINNLNTSIAATSSSSRGLNTLNSNTTSPLPLSARGGINPLNTSVSTPLSSNNSNSSTPVVMRDTFPPEKNIVRSNSLLSLSSPAMSNYTTGSSMPSSNEPSPKSLTPPQALFSKRIDARTKHLSMPKQQGGYLGDISGASFLNSSPLTTTVKSPPISQGMKSPTHRKPITLSNLPSVIVTEETKYDDTVSLHDDGSLSGRSDTSINSTRSDSALLSNYIGHHRRKSYRSTEERKLSDVGEDAEKPPSPTKSNKSISPTSKSSSPKVEDNNTERTVFAFGNSSRFGKTKSSLKKEAAGFSGLSINMSFVSTSSVAYGSKAMNKDMNLNLGSVDLSKLASDIEAGYEETELQKKQEEALKPENFMLEFMDNGVMVIDKDLEVNEDGMRLTGTKKLVTKAMKEDLLHIEELGRGASAVVHKYFHIPTFKVIACKEIKVGDAGKRSQLVKEIKALKTNMINIDGSSPHGSDGVTIEGIVRMHDAFSNPTNATVSIVLEYMDGGSLQSVVDYGGIMDERWLGRIAKQLLEALNAIHSKGMIHRDIKPANILLNSNGDAKLSDFGIIKEVGLEELGAETFVGTLVYMSPERVMSKMYNTKADIWSLGFSLYAAATGKGAIPQAAANGYWGANELYRKAMAGEELPIDYECLPSEEFENFLRCMMDVNPEIRDSASILLFHDFIHMNHDDDGRALSLSDEFVIPSLPSDKVIRRQFRRICKKLYYHYVSAMKKEFKVDFNARFEMPLFERGLASRVRKLADQLGVETDYAQIRFQKLKSRLTKKMAFLREYYSRPRVTSKDEIVVKDEKEDDDDSDKDDKDDKDEKEDEEKGDYRSAKLSPNPAVASPVETGTNRSQMNSINYSLNLENVNPKLFPLSITFPLLKSYSSSSLTSPFNTSNEATPSSSPFPFGKRNFNTTITS